MTATDTVTSSITGTTGSIVVSPGATGAFVVSVPQFIPASAFPSDFPVSIPEGVQVMGRGGVCIVSPSGEVIAGPLYDEVGMITADCDLRDALHAKRYFDVAGHYGRADVLAPTPD